MTATKPNSCFVPYVLPWRIAHPPGLKFGKKRFRTRLSLYGKAQHASIEAVSSGKETERHEQCTGEKHMGYHEKDVKLILAPMEVLGDRQFRAAISTIGGMDEAVHEFIRITSPRIEEIRGAIGKRYDAGEMGSIPLAAQIMGADAEAMGAACAELVYNRNAHRVDLNCGCPAKKVNGKGAGASLLRSPECLHDVAKAMVDGVKGSGAVVSLKMRSGYEGTGLFEENVLAAVEAGVSMLTVHPRTKVQGYSGEACWDLIGEAKRICGDGVEVVGNGDVCCAGDAVRMLRETGCDHVMVGRGAVRNPWIFWEIREALLEDGVVAGRVERRFETERKFYEAYLNAGGGVDEWSSGKVHSMKIGRLKMLVGFASCVGEEERGRLLRSGRGGDAREFLGEVLEGVWDWYKEN